MAFAETIIVQAWTRSGGRCECARDRHGHEGRCSADLVWNLRGGWTPARRTTWGTDVLGNCEVLCRACQGPRIRPTE